MADQILALNAGGFVNEIGQAHEIRQKEGYFSSCYNNGIYEYHDPEELDSSNVEAGVPTEKLPKAVEAKDRDKRTQYGDTTVYRYYFSSLGLLYTVILLAIEVPNAFLETFPSTALHDGSMEPS